MLSRILRISSLNWRIRALFVVVAALLVAFSVTLQTSAASNLVQISSDPYTNSTSQHKTEVEPDTFSYGSTIVSAFQVGRFNDGGASNVGWATSTNGGSTWTHGFLPGTTPYSTPTGSYGRLSDATVSYDAKYNTWIITSLAVSDSGGSVLGAAVIVNLSKDGGLTWSNPVVVSTAASGAEYDKSWSVCDNTTTSPYYGHCYIEWDLPSSGDSVVMSTSTDGGNTWGSPLTVGSGASGLGGQPLVQPSGTVIVPFFGDSSTISSFTSTNGGTSWGNIVTVATVTDHQVAGNIRSEALPSAEIDSSGKVYVVWQDCRFERNCSANDIVLSTSSNGTTWSAVKRIPIDAVGSGVDHFIPGIAVDKSTSGTTAHLALAYYYYSSTNCTTATCKLNVGYINSTNGGTSWSARSQLAGPMMLTWLANTTLGYMVGDYISTSFSGGKAYPVFAVATAPTGSGQFNEAMDSVTGGLKVRGGTHKAASTEVVEPIHATGVRFRTTF